MCVCATSVTTSIQSNVPHPLPNGNDVDKKEIRKINDTTEDTK
jgi:hypothetical protein